MSSTDSHIRKGSCGGRARRSAGDTTTNSRKVYVCVPLLPGDVLLTAGTFQQHLYHGSLSYTDSADWRNVLSKYQACSEAREVLQSQRFLKYFDPSTPLQEDRSVITFRKTQIITHSARHLPCRRRRPGPPCAVDLTPRRAPTPRPLRSLHLQARLIMIIV